MAGFADQRARAMPNENRSRQSDRSCSATLRLRRCRTSDSAEQDRLRIGRTSRSFAQEDLRLRQIAPTGALCFTTVGPGSNALYAEVFSHWTPRIRHHVKEFYCSTTRNSRPAGAMRLGQGGSGPKGRLTSCVPIRRWYARKVSWTRSAGGTRHFKGSCDIRPVTLAVFTGVVRGASQRDAPCIVPDHPRTPVIHREEIQRTSFAGRMPIRPNRTF